MTFCLISLFPFLPLPVMPRQDGKVAIVTGGGRGIGYEVVRHMASLGVHVIIGTVPHHMGDTQACEETNMRAWQ